MTHVAVTPFDFFHLGDRFGGHFYPSPNAIPVARPAHRFDLEPVVPVAAFVPEEGGKGGAVRNQEVQIPIVIVISDGHAAAGLFHPKPFAAQERNIGERPIAVIPEKLVRLGIRKRFVHLFDIVFDVTVGNEQVQIRIVVVI